MSFKKNKKTSFKTKLATILLLSLFLGCFSSAKASTITISTPAKQNLNDTTIPYNLRSFNESDYFSSEIDDTIVKTSSPFVFENIPSPSEYKPKSIEKTEFMVSDEDNNYFSADNITSTTKVSYSLFFNRKIKTSINSSIGFSTKETVLSSIKASISSTIRFTIYKCPTTMSLGLSVPVL